MGPEGLPVEGLVEPRAREPGQVADVPVPEALVEAASAGVVGRGEEGQVIGDRAGGRLGGREQDRADAGLLARLGDQEETEVRRPSERPAGDDPGQAEEAPPRRGRDQEPVTRCQPPPEGTRARSGRSRRSAGGAVTSP